MRSGPSGQAATGVSALAVALLAVVLLASACVSGDAEEADPGGEAVNPENGAADEEENGEAGPEALATSLGTSTEGREELLFEVFTLDRTPNELLILEFEVTNHTEENLRFSSAIAGNQEIATAHGVTLIDGANMQRYFPQEYTNGDCFCSSWEGQRHLEPGDTIEAWVVYPAPPQDVESVTIELGIAPSLIDVPIGESAELREPEGELDEPIILDIVSLSDDLDDGTGRSESGDETAIMLSTDVLFDIDESELTDEAERILEEAAAEIDAASGELIQIDGHADNTGTDAINDPLSLDRAEAVQERLEDLITRSGLDYEAEGHGSGDPIADNDTEEGREKNRRVTVTFTP